MKKTYAILDKDGFVQDPDKELKTKGVKADALYCYLTPE